jgi:hypothetical protein
LPALQKTCGQRWAWNADKMLSVAQEFYDGDGKKLITYPRAEARYLSENQIGDVPTIVGALVRLRGFAHIEVGTPVIRRGKSGHFYDKGLEDALVRVSYLAMHIEGHLAELDINPLMLLGPGYASTGSWLAGRICR